MGRQNLSRAPRWFLLVAVAMCAVFLAFTDSEDSTSFESYPAVYFKVVPDASAEHQRLEGIFLGREDAAIRGEPLPGRALELPRVWRKAGLHPYLSNVLPGVEFYVVKGQALVFLDDEWLLAMKRDTSYRLPDDLNRLLYDCGIEFTTDEVGTWTRTGVLIWSSVYRARVVANPELAGKIDYWDIPCFPKLTIEEIDIDTVVPECYGWGRVVLRLPADRIELRIWTTRVPDPSGAGGPSRIVPITIDEEGGERPVDIDRNFWGTSRD